MPHLRFMFIAFAVLCLAGTVEAASEKEILKLSMAIEAALNHNPKVDRQYAERAIADNRIEEQESRFYPEIKASAKAGTVRANNATSRGINQSGPTSTSGLGQGSVTITQLLFNGNETRKRIDAAQARRESADTKIRDVRLKLALDTTLAYLDIVRSRDSIEKIDAHIKKLEKDISRIKTKVDSGAQSATALQEARNILLKTKNQRHEIRKQLSTAQARYEQFTGEMPKPERMARPVPPLDTIPSTQKAALNYATNHHPRIKAATMQAKARDHAVDAERAKIYPDLKGELSYTKRDLDRALGGMLEDKRAILRMDWNFATGGEQFARVDRARKEYSKLLARKRAIMRSVRSAIKTAFAERQSARAQLENLRKQHDILKSHKQTLTTKFEGGQVSLLNLLKVEDKLFRLKMKLRNTQYKVLSTQFSILASTGRLYDALKISRVSSK